MNKFILPVAALAVCLGSSAAFAQDTDKTTTTVATPEGTTQTTTMKSDDGYKQYQRTITTKKHYTASAFVAPSGYVYSRYSVGQRVNPELLGSTYVLTAYGDYALEAPPAPSLTWIRVGDDAMLVDSKTGEVVQTDYDLFKN